MPDPALELPLIGGHGKRIAIIGARVHGRPDLVRGLVRRCLPGTVIVSGGGAGVDTWVEEEALHCDLKTAIHRPKARTRVAFLARNADIAADGLDELHAFHWWGSTGTLHTLGLARQRHVRIVEHPPEPQLELHTAAWGLRDEGAILNITRGWAEEHRLSATWQRIPERLRARQLVEHVVELQAQGLDILRIQYRLKEEGAPSLGEAWAPSSSLLKATLKVRDEAEALEKAGREKDAAYLWASAWDRYQNGWSERGSNEVGFHAEMKRSFREKPILWGWLLAQPRLVLACKCARGDRCHRCLVAGYVAKCSPGVQVMGEIPRVKSAR
jgi:hypothetical protein